eukprot:COSAG05_NODE_2357_length_3186_cov_2.218983_3_plen_548_part_00
MAAAPHFRAAPNSPPPRGYETIDPRFWPLDETQVAFQAATAPMRGAQPSKQSPAAANRAATAAPADTSRHGHSASAGDMSSSFHRWDLTPTPSATPVADPGVELEVGEDEPSPRDEKGSSRSPSPFREAGIMVLATTTKAKPKVEDDFLGQQQRSAEARVLVSDAAERLRAFTKKLYEDKDWFDEAEAQIMKTSFEQAIAIDEWNSNAKKGLIRVNALINTHKSTVRQQRSSMRVLKLFMDHFGPDWEEATLIDHSNSSEEQIRKVFTLLDEDQSGKLDRDEVETLMCFFAGSGDAVPEVVVNEAMLQMDDDGSGEVDFDEFWEWWSSPAGKQTLERLQGDPDEILPSRPTTAVGMEQRPASPMGGLQQRCKEEFQRLDLDGSGTISISELHVLLQRILGPGSTQREVIEAEQKSKGSTSTQHAATEGEERPEDGVEVAVEAEAEEDYDDGIISRADVEKIMARIDADGDSTIDYAEFVAFMQSLDGVAAGQLGTSSSKAMKGLEGTIKQLRGEIYDGITGKGRLRGARAMGKIVQLPNYLFASDFS